MDPLHQDNSPYIMGGYEYYSDDANLFAFNGDANHPYTEANAIWLAQPQAVYAHNSDNFVFESNPYNVSAADNVSAVAIDKHYDNPVNISSWITTASPTGYPYQYDNTLHNSGCSSLPAAPVSTAPSATLVAEAAFMPVVHHTKMGGFPPVDMVSLNYGSPYPSSGVSHSTPYTRVISTSTSASSCPGSSSTLATPRFDPTTHFAPSLLACGETRYRKPSWANPVTPDTSDVFTTVPLAPPPVKPSIQLRRPGNFRLSGQSPAVTTPQQATSANMPRQSLGGRSLRSTPSIESLRDLSEEQESPAQPTVPKSLMSPFSSLAPDATSMSRTYSAPCSFLNNCTLENAASSHSRQASETWTSPFTSEPLMSSPNPNSAAKVVKRKLSAKDSSSAPSMMRSVTTSGLWTSPVTAEGWGPSGHLSLAAPTMLRSASGSDFARMTANLESGPFAPSRMDGWTSQVPQPNRRGVGLQAPDAIDTSCINTSATIPALTVLPADESSPFSSEPRHLIVAGTATARPTKKIPKRAQAGPSAVKLTFMNLGPKDGEEITSAVAESGKSKRKRPEDSSSGDDTLVRKKRSKSQTSRPTSA